MNSPHNPHIVLIGGDGIGPEITTVARQVLDYAFKKYQLQINWQEALAGGIAIDTVGEPLPKETIKLCQKADAILMGAVGGPKWDSNPSQLRPERAILGLRKELGLFCNLRPIKIYPALQEYSPLKPELVSAVDLIIVRELTGGIYFGDRQEAIVINNDEYAWDKEEYHRYEIERIMNVAVDLAQKRRHKITSVDKANVLASSRLWRKISREQSLQHPECTWENLYVDNTAMQLVVNPAQFDIIVTSNLFGDILSDEGAVISGSIGLLPSASLGTGTALYEPIHGSAPDIAGQNIANPLGTILSAAMMCRYSLDLPNIATDIENAVEIVLSQGYRTADNYREGCILCSTTEMGEKIIAALN